MRMTSTNQRFFDLQVNDREHVAGKNYIAQRKLRIDRSAASRALGRISAAEVRRGIDTRCQPS
jgi:hypothetical protein